MNESSKKTTQAFSFRFAKNASSWFRWLLVLSVAIGCCVGSIACAADRPNILWIVAEDISPLLGCYGDADATTPNIDRFARRSHVFRHAYATGADLCPFAFVHGNRHVRDFIGDTELAK